MTAAAPKNAAKKIYIGLMPDKPKVAPDNNTSPTNSVAPDVTPNTNGSTIAFRKNACKSNPATASEAPPIIVANVRGSLILSTIDL